jgi:hypothetical protein
MKRLVTVVLAFGVLLSSAPPSRGDEKTDLAPIPDADAQKKAEALVKEIFQAEYAKASASKVPADKAMLASKLLDQAAETKDDPVARFVLLREARDLGTEGVAPSLAFGAIDTMAKSYQVNALEMKTAVLASIEARFATGTVAWPIAKSALALIDVAVDADDYAAAARLEKIASASAKAAKDEWLAQRVANRTAEVENQRMLFAAIRPSLATLAELPADPEANLAVGKYYCFAKGQWDKGLPKLALGKDADLKTLAEKEIAAPSAANEQLELGDGWWEVAARAPQGKAIIQARAIHWYRLAGPKLTGLSKAKADKRVAEADASKADPLEQGLKELFHGKTTYNRQTGVLKLEYDFTDTKQLADFERYPRDLKPWLEGGTLALKKGDMLTHITRFKSLTIKAKVKANSEGDAIVAHINPQSFVSIGTGKPPHWAKKPTDHTIGIFIWTQGAKGEPDLVLSKHFPSGERWDMELDITSKAVNLKVGDIDLTKAKDSVVACYPVLNGGVLGNTFYKVVFEGTLDDAWVNQHFPDKK